MEKQYTARTDIVSEASNQRSMMALKQLFIIMVLSFGIGILSAGLYYLLNYVIFTPLLCSGGIENKCQNSPAISGTASLIFTMLGCLFVLVWQRIYRPLLIVLLSVISLWNFVLLTITYPWVIALIITGFVYTLVITLFTWTSQLRNFYISAAIGIVAAIIIRIVIAA